MAAELGHWLGNEDGKHGQERPLDHLKSPSGVERLLRTSSLVLNQCRLKTNIREHHQSLVHHENQGSQAERFREQKTCKRHVADQTNGLRCPKTRGFKCRPLQETTLDSPGVLFTRYLHGAHLPNQST